MINRLLLPLLATPLFAGELTVEKAPFRIEHRFTATAVPTELGGLKLEPLGWSDFTVETIVDHGSSVKKGDVLISCKRESYDRRLEDARRELASKKLALATEELAFSKLEREVQINLQASLRAKEIADQDLDYYTKTGRNAEEASVAHRLKRQRLRLAGAKEELKQLKQMYEEDDLTEETEEIILKRQQASVESAEFDMKEAERTSELTLKNSIPRKAENYQRAAEQATIAYEKAEKDLPRSLEAGKLALTGSRIALTRQQLELERLEKDGALLEWKAPMDGILFYGSFDKGSWSLGDLAKSLLVGGKLPIRRTLATVTPAEATVALSARVPAPVARSLSTESTLAVTIPGREDLSLVGKVSSLESVPGTDNQFGLGVTVEWPEDFDPGAGSKADCVAVVYETKEAVALPVAALKPEADGSWSVGIKLADGKTERRGVQRGRSSKGSIEILGGLEPGQVVVVPD